MASSKERRDDRMSNRTGETARDRDQGFGSTILQLPEGMEFIELEKRKNLNIIPYEVTMNQHPDMSQDGYPTKGDLWWRKPILVHKGIGVNNESYICPRTVGKKCPICEEVSLLSQEYTKNEKIIGQNRAKKRDVICVQDADDPKKGVQLFDVSYHLFTKLLLKEVDNGKDEYRRFAYAENGFTVNCRFEQSNWQGRKYWKIDRIDFEPREDYSARLLKQAPDLDDILIVKEYEALKNIFMQMDDDAEENNGEREQSPSSRKEPAKEEEPFEDEPEKPPIEEELTGADLIGKTVIHSDGSECEVKDYDKKKDIYDIEDSAGEIWEVSPDEFTVKEEEGSPAPRPSSRGSGKKSGDDVCPHNHDWGKDCGQQTECLKTCEEDVWERCNAEHEKIKGK